MNILAIGAHFDDVELGCGGALARHVARGDRVYAYVATVSGFRDPGGKTVRHSRKAQAEGKRAMACLGVRPLCGKFKTFALEFAEPLNRELVKIIAEKKIDLVYTHWTGDVHHDHQALARATLHACRHVPRILMYRSNWYDGGEPFPGSFYVDISDYWDVKQRALQQHASEMTRTYHQWIPYFERDALNAGLQIAVRYAEVFAVVRWLEQ